MIDRTMQSVVFAHPTNCCLSVLSSVLHGRHLYAGHNAQTFQQNAYVPAMLIDTIDLYHDIPLSVTRGRGHDTIVGDSLKFVGLQKYSVRNSGVMSVSYGAFVCYVCW